MVALLLAKRSASIPRAGSLGRVWSGSISWRSWRCRRPTSARYRNSAVAVLWRAAFQSTWGRIVGEVDERAKSGFLGETSALLFPVNWPEAVAEQLANHRLWHWAMRRSCLCRQINEMDQRQDVDGVVVPELQVNDARRHSLLGRYLPIELLKPPINRDDRGSWS